MKIEICEEALKCMNNLKPIEEYLEEGIDLIKHAFSKDLTENERKNQLIRISELALIMEYLTNNIKNTNN